jgi:hypothetical protein
MDSDHERVAKVKLLASRDFKISYPKLYQGSNVRHLYGKIDKLKWLKDLIEHHTTLLKNPKSLAQDGVAHEGPIR